MVKIFNLIFALCIFTILIGCATALNPTPEDLVRADYGPRPPDNYQEIIKGFYSKILFDPYTAVYTFDGVESGWGRWLNKITYGWWCCGTINAKNRMGGYVGTKRFAFLFRDNQMIRVEEGLEAEKICGRS